MLYALAFGLWPGIDDLSLRRAIFVFSALALMIIFGISRPWPRAVRLLLGWCLVCFFINWMWVVVTMNLNAQLLWVASIRKFERILAGAVVFGVLLGMRHRRQAVSAIRWTAIVLSIWAIVQAAGFSPIFHRTDYGRAVPGFQLGSFLLHQNYLAAFLAVSLFFFLERPWVWGLTLTIPVLALQQTSSAIVAVAVGLVVWAHNTMRPLRWWQAGAMVATVLPYITLVDPLPSQMNRLAVWWRVIGRIAERPLVNLVGHGLGSMQPILASMPGISPDQVHSEILQFWFEAGWPGLAAVVILAIHSVRLVQHAPTGMAHYSGALAAVWVLAVGSVPLQVPALALVGLYILATLEAHYADTGIDTV